MSDKLCPQRLCHYPHHAAWSQVYFPAKQTRVYRQAPFLSAVSHHAGSESRVLCSACLEIAPLNYMKAVPFLHQNCAGLSQRLTHH